jgi:hypothetical protein
LERHSAASEGLKMNVYRAIIGCAAAFAAAIAAPATATTYFFVGTITSFTDENGVLPAVQVAGLSFRGTITFDLSEIDSSNVTSDRISPIEVGELLTVDTPDDRAFVSRYGPETLFSGILPFNPVVFSTGAASATCRGAGGVTLQGSSQMSFSLGCVDGGGLRIVGQGRYSDRLAAVPEPASWALMIAGISAAGGALRRRRAASTKVSFA